MPRLNSSVRAIQVCEDDMAVLITACDQVDLFRHTWALLYQRRKMTAAAYRDGRDALDYIAHALQLARHNTGRLRREVAA